MNPLKGNKKIDFLFEKGVRFSSEFVRCVFLKQETDELFYVVSVPKKSFPRAVDRNKIKRRLKNIMNAAVKKIPIKFQYSYLVIAKPTMLNNEFKLIKETLFQEFNKIKK